MIHRVNHLLQSHHRLRFLISRTAKRFEEPDSDTSAPGLVISVAESELLNAMRMVIQAPSSQALARPRPNHTKRRLDCDT